MGGRDRPFFLAGPQNGNGFLTRKVTLQTMVEQAVGSLGFELVELERSAGGLLRVTIDFPWSGDAGAAPRAIGVDDCEAVSRQLQYALEVDDVDYQRLEVSSPGTDRPLRTRADFERFEGEQVAIVLKEPIADDDGSPAAAQVGRKRFTGRLQKADAPSDDWLLLWHEAPRRESRKPRGQPGRQKAGQQQVLAFGLDELQSARLQPELDFKRSKKGKGRRKRA